MGAGIATGWTAGGFGVRVPVGSRIFTSPIVQTGSGGPPSVLSKGYRGLLHRGCVRDKRASQPEAAVAEVAPVRNQALLREDAWGSGSITPRDLNLGSKRERQILMSRYQSGNMAGEIWVQWFSCCINQPAAQQRKRVQQRVRRIDRSMIGSPTNFQHTGHIGSGDVDTGNSRLRAIQNQMQSKGGYETAFSTVQVQHGFVWE
ncbi:CDC42 small effector protein-like protein [Cryptotermes secundus]|uniref:CDC42 small effector protein-like protein n=1 Tax=Cryptotermes secundus TaxID=105785 RepID=A0A2J7PV72_9NEOP|nr:CDC42 small effector protein-like protein [Cryptotermes secundus]